MSRPLRIAHLADTHLGYRAYARTDLDTGRNQRSVDVERAYARVVGDILAQDVDLVIHAGDVFHHPRPSWSAVRAFVEQTRRLTDAGLPVVIIAGNHDMPRLRTSDSLFSVLSLALSGVWIVAGYEMAHIPFPALDLTVTAYPHGALTVPTPDIPLPDPRTRNVLVTHGLMTGVPLMGQRSHEPGETELSETMFDPNFQYIALGHFHEGGNYGPNTYYSGSTERTGWGDVKVRPGYLLVELGADEVQVEPRPIETRPMIPLDPISATGRSASDIAERILSEAERLRQPEAMVRVRLDDVTRDVRREVDGLVRREALNHVWSLEVRTPTEINAAVFGGSPLDLPSLDLLEMFDQFVGERVTNDAMTKDFADVFREKGKQALRDARIAAEQAESVEEVPA